MENFVWRNKTRIIFGKDSQREVGKAVKQHADKILLHYEGDASLIKKLGIYQTVVESLKQENISFVELGGVVPNPRLSLVREGIELCKKENISFVLAVGGGSVIDSAKAIALGICHEGDVWEFFNGKEPKASCGVGVVLTIPGAGSEMSESSIITDEVSMKKAVCDTEHNFPEFSILDPQVCYTIPKKLMAAGIADILSHLMERYFTRVENNALSDSLLEATMKTVVEYGPLLLEDQRNYDYASQIMWAATVAHNDMIACGRIADWTSHRIEHEISAIYDLTHGAGMAVVFPAWMEYTKTSKPEVFERFFRRVFQVEGIEEGIQELKSFFESLGLALSLKEYGIGDEHFEQMAQKALGSNSTIGRFAVLNKQDIINILNKIK